MIATYIPWHGAVCSKWFCSIKCSLSVKCLGGCRVSDTLLGSALWLSEPYPRCCGTVSVGTELGCVLWGRISFPATGSNTCTLFGLVWSCWSRGRLWALGESLTAACLFSWTLLSCFCFAIWRVTLVFFSSASSDALFASNCLRYPAQPDPWSCCAAAFCSWHWEKASLVDPSCSCGCGSDAADLVDCAVVSPFSLAKKRGDLILMGGDLILIEHLSFPQKSYLWMYRKIRIHNLVRSQRGGCVGSESSKDYTHNPLDLFYMLHPSFSLCDKSCAHPFRTFAPGQ